MCVRVTNVNHVDLNVFEFDHDLTLAFVLANADGTVYHRYGGRSARSPMNMVSLVELMKEGVQSHREYQREPAPPPQRPPFYLDEVIEGQLRGRISSVFGCYHCHYAREAKQYLAMEAGAWTPDRYWIFPEPDRIGIVVEQARQNVIREVLADSPAERAGLRSGDLLDRLGGKRVRTKYDIQWILHELDDEPASLGFVARRGADRIAGSLALPTQWKVGDPADYAWRVRNVYTRHMEKFLPAPGFVGQSLSEDEREALHPSAPSFALKITELNAGTYLAGIRLGDIVVEAAGRAEFSTVRDFYAWCESLRREGRDIRMRLFRRGEELNVMVPLSSLNYSRIEKAPRATLGFVVQQLGGGGGLRVGTVTTGSSAERAGIEVGDRLVKIDGRVFETREEVTTYLNDKAPGDLVTVDVTRAGSRRELGFMLGGEEARRSSLARLTEPVRQRGQLVTCVVSIRLPKHKHIYSMHRKSFGVPTQLRFRGRGYELVGPTEEPEPRKLEWEGVEAMWIHEGTVEFRQKIRVTDVKGFQLLLQAYAQVCDEVGCHEFRAVVGSDGLETHFTDYRGRFELQPVVRRVSGMKAKSEVPATRQKGEETPRRFPAASGAGAGG